MRRREIVLSLGLLLAGAGPAAAAPPEPPDGLARALADLGAREGRVRQAAQAWLADHLDSRKVGAFLEALSGKEDPEVRARAVEALSDRLDLFPPLARSFLGRETPFLREALRAQVRRGLPPLPRDPEEFRPLPAGQVRLEGGRPWTPFRLWGILARNLAFPLPILAWPSLPDQVWTPPFSWGGEPGRLLLPRGGGPWLGGTRVRIRKDCLLWTPAGPPPGEDLAALTVSLLKSLARGGREARRAALSLGQVPFLPLGAFFLEEARARLGEEALPFLWGLGSFALRSGFGPAPAKEARSLLAEALPRLQGEGLAWAASGLAALGPGLGEEGGDLLGKIWKEAPRKARWKVLLPLLGTPFPGTAPFLKGALFQGADSPREAACLVRALALQGARIPREVVVRAMRRAGRGAGLFGARLLGPLEKKEGPWAARALMEGPPGVAELAACALGGTPRWGWKVLLESLPGAGDPRRLSSLLLGLRLARDRGASGLGPALAAAWENVRGEGRKPLAAALGLLLDEGEFLGEGPEEANPPVSAWKVKDRFQELFPDLSVFLEELARREEPLRRPAARALGRLHGLRRDFRVIRYFPWAREKEGRKALFLLLQEWVQVHPQGESLLETAFLRGRWAGFFRGEEGRAGVRILLAGGPPPWAGLDLEVEDPWSWALAFPER